MTLYELSLQYEQEAAIIRARISELNAKADVTHAERERRALEARIRALYPMYRESIRTARHLRRYAN